MISLIHSTKKKKRYLIKSYHMGDHFSQYLFLQFKKKNENKNYYFAEITSTNDKRINRFIQTIITKL